MPHKLLRGMAIIVLLVVEAGNASGQISHRVGNLGDLSRMEIVGLASYAEADVIERLRNDEEVFVAAHPLAPLNVLLETIDRRLSAGLLVAGFGEAQVETEVDEENSRLISKVSEGKRFRTGALRIENVGKLNIDQLKRRLTERSPPREAVLPVFDENAPGQVAYWTDRDGDRVELSDPVWVANEWARFDDGSMASLREKVTHALDDLGFRAAEFDLLLVPESETLEVDLLIRFRDEGPATELGKIEIRGLERDTVDALLTYLDLHEGMLLTRQRETKLHYDLWKSGRFRSFRTSLVDPFLNNPYALILTVRESASAPPIDGPLERHEEALLKMGRWLSRPRDWAGDLVLCLQGETEEFTGILAPKDGLLVSVRSRTAPGNQPIALVGSCEELGIYPKHSQHYLSATQPGIRFNLEVDYGLTDSEDSSDDYSIQLRSSFSFAGGKDDPDRPPLGVFVNVSPAACLAIANDPQAVLSWEGPVLTVVTDLVVLELDERDGHLLRIEVPAISENATVRFVKDAFKEALEEVHQLAAVRQNAFQPDAPLRSVFSFLIRDEMLDQSLSWIQSVFQFEMDEEEVRSVHLAAQLFALGLLEPIATEFGFLSSAETPQEDAFRIPGQSGAPATSTVKGMALASVPMADKLFPNNSWPWTVWRETGLLLAGRSEYSGQIVKQISLTEEFGPTGIMVVASLLDRVSPTASEAIAAHGVELIAGDHFRRDYLPLLDDQHQVGRLFRRVCELLISLEDGELDAFRAAMPEHWRAPFSGFVEELRQNPRRPVEESIAAALDVAWESGLKSLVKERLADLSSRGSANAGDPPMQKALR